MSGGRLKAKVHLIYNYTLEEQYYDKHLSIFLHYISELYALSISNLEPKLTVN